MKNLGFLYHLSPWDSLKCALIWVGVPLLSMFEGHCNPQQGHVWQLLSRDKEEGLSAYPAAASARLC